MNKIITLILLLVFASAQAQYQETRKIGKHQYISVAQAIEVEYIHSDRNEVIVECENKAHFDLLVTDVKNGNLNIQYKPNSSVSTKKANKVIVYSNSILEKAEATSSGKLTLKDAFTTSSFKLDASSAGRIFTNTIKANKIEIDVSSSAKIETMINTGKVEIDASSLGFVNITGKAENVEADMSSSANIDLSKLTIGTLAVDGSSLASLTFYTATTLTNKLSSSAKVYYTKIPGSIPENRLSSGGKFLQK